MASIRRVPLPVLLLLLVLSAWSIGYILADSAVPALRHMIVFKSLADDVPFEIAGGLLVLRGIRGHRGWLLIGIGCVCWASGDVYWSLRLANDTSPPVPSPADAGYLLFDPFVFLGMLMLIRTRIPKVARTLGVDALAAALSIGALSAALVVEPVLHAASGGWLAIATNLAYPLGDLAMLALIVVAAALLDWRLTRTLALLGCGIISFWVADSLYLIADATNTYGQYAWYNPLWYVAPILFAWAGWLYERPVAPKRMAETLRGMAMLLTSATLALGILVASSIHPVGALGIGLAAGSISTTLARLIMTWRENVALLCRSQTEALTDALTGLANRRALADDLADGLVGASVEEPLELALFDLNGFKHYNDTYGHQAGDALLQRVAHKLAEGLGEAGTLYRMGGDEFCALIHPGRDPEADVAHRAAQTMQESGGGFTVDCAFGVVALPAEAPDAETALRLADGRMYADKHGSRMSASRQSKDVLLSALFERDPKLGNHVSDVAAMAAQIARAYGLPPEEVERVRQTAELHDIGKVAIPDAILNKPGPLDPEEWDFMRGHTLIGERIINAAPALRPVGLMVRSTHERMDGNGYPDGLRGEEIPLGSRIVFACDAFDAMVSDRAYRKGMSEAAALAELRRCAGTQFDPEVVQHFARVLAARNAQRELALTA